MNDWTIAPFRCINLWRQKAAAARQFHSAFYWVWLVLGTPFWVLACLGYVGCLMLFPSAALSVGLAIVSYNPGVGWYVFAAAVVIFWSSVTVFQVAVVLRQVRSRIFDIEAATTAVLMTLGVLVAAWYVPYAIERFAT